MGIYFSETIMQALSSRFVNLKNEHNVSSVLKCDTSAQKFLMAPHLLQNKSRVLTMTHEIWLPEPLSSSSPFLAFSTFVFLCSLGPAAHSCFRALACPLSST